MNRVVSQVILFSKGLVGVALLAALLPGLAGAQVVINELQVDNRTTLLNGPDTPQWVELYNSSGVDIDLGTDGGGWYLTDSTNSPAKFAFTPGTIIHGGSLLLVFVDNNTASPGLHTGFTLKKTGDDLTLYRGPINAPRLQDRVVFGLQVADLSLGRVPDFTGPFALNTPTPELPNAGFPSMTSTNLKINEWMPNPSSGDDWFELYNPETNVTDISGMVWADGGSSPALNRALPPLSFIAPGGFIQFFADDLANSDFDHVGFRLSSSNDRISLYAADRATLIDQVAWTTNQLGNVSTGRLPDGSTNVVAFAVGKATPAASNFQLLTDVVISEVLTHTDDPLEDAIELQNLTTNPVDISYWWLSNSKDDPKKFRIPAGPPLPPGGFKVFYEYKGVTGGFNPNGGGTDRSFTLNSAHGDQVVLSAGDAVGNLGFFRVIRDFGSAENGVSFGRYVTSEGKVEFVAMGLRTFGMDNPGTLTQFRQGMGLTNAYPKIGPLVINEIMYHPPDVSVGGNVTDNSLDEYLEIYNLAATNVTLYDAAGFYFDANFPQYGIYADGRTNTWRIRSAVDFDFPTNVALGPGQYLLVVNFDPADSLQLTAFRDKFGVLSNVQILGPFHGKLSNSGATIEMYKPDPPQGPQHPDFRFVPYILVEKIKYSDASPWPTDADGRGFSLQRIKPEEYANDPINWTTALPSPGRQLIRIESAQKQGSAFVLSFTGVANSGYTVQYKNLLGSVGWTKLTDLPSRTNTGVRFVTNSPIPATVSNRFYRVVTPIQP